jgi:hypothetical protein
MTETEELKTLLEEKHGEVLTTNEATAKYEFHAFQAPFASVTRRSDGVKGLIQFNHRPRFYFDFN